MNNVRLTSPAGLDPYPVGFLRFVGLHLQTKQTSIVQTSPRMKVRFKLPLKQLWPNFDRDGKNEKRIS